MRPVAPITAVLIVSPPSSARSVSGRAQHHDGARQADLVLACRDASPPTGH
jgi:hypothetical protein